MSEMFKNRKTATHESNYLESVGARPRAPTPSKSRETSLDHFFLPRKPAEVRSVTPVAPLSSTACISQPLVKPTREFDLTVDTPKNEPKKEQKIESRMPGAFPRPGPFRSSLLGKRAILPEEEPPAPTNVYYKPSYYRGQALPKHLCEAVPVKEKCNNFSLNLADVFNDGATRPNSGEDRPKPSAGNDLLSRLTARSDYSFPVLPPSATNKPLPGKKRTDDDDWENRKTFGECVQSVLTNPFDLHINHDNFVGYVLPLEFKDSRQYRDKLLDTLLDEVRATFVSRLSSEEYKKLPLITATLEGMWQDKDHNRVVALSHLSSSADKSVSDCFKKYSLIACEFPDNLGRRRTYLGLNTNLKRPERSGLKRLKADQNDPDEQVCFAFPPQAAQFLSKLKDQKSFQFKYFESLVSAKREIKILLRISVKEMPLLTEIINGKGFEQLESRGGEDRRADFPVTGVPEDKPYLPNRPAQVVREERQAVERLTRAISDSRVLNQSQKDAIISCVMDKRQVGMIQGPPGTGKSFTLLEIVMALMQSSPNCPKKILICTPSNGALDELLVRFARQYSVFDPSFFLEDPNRPTHPFHENLFGDLTKKTSDDLFKWTADRLSRVAEEFGKVRILRVGSGFENSPRSIFPFCLEHITFNLCRGVDKNLLQRKIGILHDHLKHLEQLAPENGPRSKALVTVRAEFEILIEILSLLVKGKTHQAEIIMISKAKIIFSTLNSSAKKQMKGVRGQVSTVIIDEASQATEVQTLIPLHLKPDRAILIGDPCQLPATTFHPLSTKLNLQRSCMERLKKMEFPMFMLKIQYRMLPLIAEFPSHQFYNNELRHSQRLQQPSPYPDQVGRAIEQLGRGQPVRFFNCTGFTEKIRNSFCNKMEAEVIVGMVRQLWDLDVRNVGVISPYSEQCRLLLGRLRESDMFGVEVSTVDSFQGREKEVIIISTVRSLNKTGTDSLGFVSDEKRLNVSITRAKYLLLLVGNHQTLEQDEIWKAYLEFLGQKRLVGSEEEIKKLT